jgi:hypothetical protein
MTRSFPSRGISTVSYGFGLAWHDYLRDPIDGSVMLQWISHPLRTYTVQTSTDLINWTSLVTGPASGTGITSYTHTTPSGNRLMYRIVVTD